MTPTCLCAPSLPLADTPLQQLGLQTGILRVGNPWLRSSYLRTFHDGSPSLPFSRRTFHHVLGQERTFCHSAPVLVLVPRRCGIHPPAIQWPIRVLSFPTSVPFSTSVRPQLHGPSPSPPPRVLCMSIVACPPFNCTPFVHLDVPCLPRPRHRFCRSTSMPTSVAS